MSVLSKDLLSFKPFIENAGYAPSIGNSRKYIVAPLILAVVMTCSSIRVQLNLANQTNKPFFGLIH